MDPLNLTEAEKKQVVRRCGKGAFAGQMPDFSVLRHKTGNETSGDALFKAKKGAMIMSKFFDKKLIKLLETDSRFTDQNGRLIKRTVIDRAWRTDHQLVRLLLSDPEVKAKFFDKIAGALVFNSNTLIEYISNKNFLGNSYTRFRNKIGLNIDGKFLKERGEVSLVWPYKDCILEGGQTREEEERKEIFFNEILAQDEIDRLFDPKILTSWKRHTAKGTAPVSEIKRDKTGTIRENLVIKGNNLSALHTLKQQFRGKVKLIYIDPPYNTSGDNNIFTYNNNFNHSSWLTFMKNRLEAAKDLLKQDGVLAVTIDDYEQAHLKILCDEVFKTENYLGTIIIQNNPRGRTINSHFATCHEYCHFYSKNQDFVSIKYLELTQEQSSLFNMEDNKGHYRLLPFRRSGGYSTKEERPNSYYPIYWNKKKNIFSITPIPDSIKIFPLDKDGNKRVWRQTKPSFMRAVREGSIVCKTTNRGHSIYMKDRIKEGRKPKTIWSDSKYDASAHGTMYLKNLFNGQKLFSYPKSIYTVTDTVKIISDDKDNDIILDFFAGSGTTGDAVMQLNKKDGGNRKFILVEQLEDHIKVCKERLEKVLQLAAIQPEEMKNSGQINAFKAAIGGKTESQTNDGKENQTSFIYCELMKYNEAFMEKIQDAKSSKELVSLWKDIAKNSFLNWYVNPEVPEDALQDFIKIGEEDAAMNQNKKKPVASKTNPSGKVNAGQKSAAGQESPEEWKNQKYIEKVFGAALKGGKTGLERQKRLLAELLNKNQLYVHLSEIDDKDFKVSKEDKRLNKLFYSTDK